MSVEASRVTSMAICCMWAWMVPHFYIEFTEYRLALEKVSLSETWKDSDDGDSSGGNNDNNNSSARERANRATVRGVCRGLTIIGTVYFVSVLCVGASTRQLDPSILTKSNAIAIGVGRMMSSCLLAYFSVELPRWLGVTYSSHKHVECYKQTLLEPSANSDKELSFRVTWSFLGHFFTMYPFLLAYFCNEAFGIVALSTGVGVSFGFAVVYCVWLGHTKLNRRSRTKIAVVLSLVIMVSSAAAFSAGCWYVKVVWHDNQNYSKEYVAATFMVWLIMCVMAHTVDYRLTQRKLAEAVLKAKVGVEGDDTVVADASENLSIDSGRGEWRYQSQVFQPPKSINWVATELSRSLGYGWRYHHHQQPNKTDETGDGSGGTTANNDKIRVQLQSHPPSDPISKVLIVNDDILFPAHKTDYIKQEGDGVVSTHRNVARISADGTIEILCSAEFHPPETSVEKSDIETQDKSESSEGKKALVDDSDGCNLSVVSMEKERGIPTLWYMLKANSCCQKRQHYQAPRRKRCNLCLVVLKWTLWTAACGWHLAFTIVNIGAAKQQRIVREALSNTFDILYPEDYTTGAMCAWDESSPNADIRTFDSLEDATNANFTVIHCGECGHCSNWNDLSLQWTTRDHLANTARNCVTKSLLGSREDVQQCNEDTIGFTEGCSDCWTHDGYCARENCMFIYLQSVFTNQVNNYNVGHDDITSATCDEALCGPDFVPCSGATRRRMNIISDIPRPVSQQCKVASEDWSSIFGHL